MTAHGHEPVLLDEVLSRLNPVPGEVAIDCTAGRGGHAAAIARRLVPGGRLLLIDRDAGNLEAATARVEDEAGLVPTRVHADFRLIAALAPRLEAPASVVLADLGVASTQIDDPGRGFAFDADGPLDMRMDPSSGESAAELLARLEQVALARIIRDWGEDPFAPQIARSVVAAREEGRLRTTADLAQAVVDAYGGRARQSRNHPATRTFQAIRIAVNEELQSLELLLEALADAAGRALAGKPAWIAPGARVAIISFHSLEDRRVKRGFALLRRMGCEDEGPITAGAEEVARNPRSRSAKLRLLRLPSR